MGEEKFFCYFAALFLNKIITVAGAVVGIKKTGKNRNECFKKREKEIK